MTTAITVNAQSDCNCSNDPKVIEYKNKMNTPYQGEQKIGASMGGNDVQACSPCMDLARAVCLCSCATTAHTPAQIQQQIAYYVDRLDKLRTAGVSDCCPYYHKNFSVNCQNAGKNKAVAAAAGGNQTQQTPSSPPKPTLADNNSSFVGAVNALGAMSNDESGKKYLESTNKIHEAAGAVKSIGSTLGASSGALNTIDGLETGAHLVNMFFGDAFSPPTEEEIRRDAEEAARKAAYQQELRVEHNKAALVLKKWDNALKSLYDSRIANYDSVTVGLRLVVLRGKEYARAFDKKSKEEMTSKHLYTIAKQVKYDEYYYGTAYVRKLIDEILKKNGSAYNEAELTRLKNNP